MQNSRHSPAAYVGGYKMHVELDVTVYFKISTVPKSHGIWLYVTCAHFVPILRTLGWVGSMVAIFQRDVLSYISSCTWVL